MPGPAEFRADLISAGTGPIRSVLVSPYRCDFGAWALACYASGHWGALREISTTVVAEETAAVTHPGKAPPGWHRLLSQGLEHGIDIYAITQAPAESDKTAMRNASVIRSFALRLPADRAYMSAYLGVDADELGALPPLHYIERDMNTGAITRGKLGPVRRQSL